MKIGFTGTRRGMTKYQAKRLEFALFLLTLSENLFEFHHGDCIGADEEADKIVSKYPQIHVVIHPPTDPAFRAFCSPYGDNRSCRKAQPYLMRNRSIVNQTDVLIACPATLEEVLRSGTWATVRHARSIGKPIVTIWPSEV